jgi:hypothetical protein
MDDLQRSPVTRNLLTCAQLTSFKSLPLTNTHTCTLAHSHTRKCIEPPLTLCQATHTHTTETDYDSQEPRRRRECDTDRCESAVNVERWARTLN